MAAATVPPVEVARVTAAKVLHPGGEVGLGRLDKQMLMIGHQHKGVQSPAIGFHRPPQPVEPLFPIGIVTDDGLALVATRDHVVQGAGEFHPQRSGHLTSLAIALPPVNH